MIIENYKQLLCWKHVDNGNYLVWYESLTGDRDTYPAMYLYTVITDGEVSHACYVSQKEQNKLFGWYHGIEVWHPSYCKQIMPQIMERSDPALAYKLAGVLPYVLQKKEGDCK
jgi:hypothetical protein